MKNFKSILQTMSKLNKFAFFNDGDLKSSQKEIYQLKEDFGKFIFKNNLFDYAEIHKIYSSFSETPTAKYMVCLYCGDFSFHFFKTDWNRDLSYMEIPIKEIDYIKGEDFSSCDASEIFPEYVGIKGLKKKFYQDKEKIKNFIGA